MVKVSHRDNKNILTLHILLLGYCANHLCVTCTYKQAQLKIITITWFNLYIFLEDVQIIHGISLHIF